MNAQRRRELKTAEQLRLELAYFEKQLRQTTSADRIRRARAAIATRARLLAAAISRETVQ